MFGILIALQINNWNEERIEQQQIADYAHALIKDLERDLAMIEVIKAEIDVLINKIDTLSAYIESRSFEELRNIDLYYHGIFGASSPSTFSFPESPFHTAYKDTNLSLLTDNMEDLKVVVNSYLTLGGYYGIRPRAENEMPRLAANARELIELLKEEYPE